MFVMEHELLVLPMRESSWSAAYLALCLIQGPISDIDFSRDKWNFTYGDHTRSKWSQECLKINVCLRFFNQGIPSPSFNGFLQ